MMDILRNNSILRSSRRILGVLRASASKIALLAAMLTCSAYAQQTEMGQLDASPSLFTIMAAIGPR